MVREWLEYSVKADAAFCFACQKFGTVDSVFTKLAIVTGNTQQREDCTSMQSVKNTWKVWQSGRRE